MVVFPAPLCPTKAATLPPSIFKFKELKVIDLMEMGYEYNYLYFFENSL